jgi:hypothetical protein
MGTHTMHTDRVLFISAPERHACDIHEALGYICEQYKYIYVILLLFLEVFTMASSVFTRETTQGGIEFGIGGFCGKLANHFTFRWGWLGLDSSDDCFSRRLICSSSRTSTLIH